MPAPTASDFDPWAELEAQTRARFADDCRAAIAAIEERKARGWFGDQRDRARQPLVVSPALCDAFARLLADEAADADEAVAKLPEHECPGCDGSGTVFDYGGPFDCAFCTGEG
jgi:hypothetical protein